MKWIELSVEVPPEYVEPMVQVFTRYGDGGVAIEQRVEDLSDDNSLMIDADMILRTYLLLDDTVKERRGYIDLAVRLIAHTYPALSLREKVVENEDWESAWKEHFQILRIGKRVIIVPSWKDYQCKATEAVVNLDPGMAFGTGHHPTTRLCLEELERLVGCGNSVLDLGVGSGILSIASARLGSKLVVGLDLDPIAVKVARRSFKLNGVLSAVKAYTGTLPQSCAMPYTFDVAVANISSKAVLANLSELNKCLKTGGFLIASGFLQEQVDEFLSGALGNGLTLTTTRHLQDWAALVFQKGQ